MFETQQHVINIKMHLHLEVQSMHYWWLWLLSSLLLLYIGAITIIVIMIIIYSSCILTYDDNNNKIVGHIALRKPPFVQFVAM